MSVEAYEDAPLVLHKTPYSAEAEQAVLGSMLIDPDCVSQVMGRLRADDFYLPPNRDIFETISRMFLNAKPIDGLTVADEMLRLDVYDEERTRPYLAQLMEITPTSANAMEYAKIVRDKAQRREIIRAATDAIRMAEAEGDDGILEAVEQRIYAIRQWKSGENTLIPLREIVPSVLNDLADICEGKKIPGLSTGFSTIDQKLEGLSNSDLIFVGARPGMGKTAFAMNVAFNVAKAGKAVAVFSLEMSRQQICMRIMSAQGMVKHSNLKKGKLDETEWNRIAEMCSILDKVGISIDDSPLSTVTEISAKCRRLDNLGLVVIDYLQLMNAEGRRENRVQAVSEISRKLKIMARELDVPVICLSQLNRDVERRENKRPVLADLRESGSIEQDADVIMFLYRDDYYNPQSDKPNIAECIVAKNRHGEPGKVELLWMPEYVTFSTLDDRTDALGV